MRATRFEAHLSAIPQGFPKIAQAFNFKPGWILTCDPSPKGTAEIARLLHSKISRTDAACLVATASWSAAVLCRLSRFRLCPSSITANYTPAH